MTLPSPKLTPTSVPETARSVNETGHVPPLWAAALIGTVVGLLTYALTEGRGEGIPAPLQGGLLTVVWTLGLGTVFLNLWGTRLPWLGLIGLAALAGLISAAPGGFSSGYGSESVAVMTLLVMLGGAGLLQAWRGGRQWDGGRTLDLLTDAPTLFVLAALLALLFYGLLQLAGALAAAVGLSSVQAWLIKPIVAIPLVLGAAAFFVAALRSQTWGQGLTRTLSGVLGYLLPVAAAVTALFVVLVPVAALRDLSALYDGFLSSYLYLSLAGATVYLTLHAFRNEAQPTLPTLLARFVRWTAYLLPLFCVLALYGLNVRVGEYGLTEARVLGLSLTFWGLLVTVALALTRRAPPFGGLSRVLPSALLGLLALALVLSVPGMRPGDIAARSQLARLQGADLSKQEARSTVQYLLRGEGQEEKAARLVALDRRTLGPAAAAELERLDKLGAGRYLGLSETAGAADIQKGVTLELAGKSAPLNNNQQATLSRELNAWLEGGDEGPVASPEPFQLCAGYPERCKVTVHALPLSGGGLRALVLDRQGMQEGRWYDLDAGGAVTRRGRFGLNAYMNSVFSNSPDSVASAWRGPVQIRRVETEVLEVGGRQLPFVEESR